jgi:hypothetical protein
MEQYAMKLFPVFAAVALVSLAACSPHSLTPSEQADERQQEFVQQRYQAEAKRIPHVSRVGQTLTIKADSGKIVSFTDDCQTAGFDCSLHDFQGMYAGGQFYRLNHTHSEFFTPDYLVSRRTGNVTDMVGPLEEKNLSPNQQLIVTAVGGDTGPEAAIHLWEIKDGELVSLVAHAFDSYGFFTMIGWNAESTAVTFSKLGSFKECKGVSKQYEWGTSVVTLQKQGTSWVLEESNVKCQT